MESTGYFFATHNIVCDFVIIHCGTNNVNQSKPEAIAVGAMKIAETSMKNHPKITTISTGMLPRDKTTIFGEQKSIKQTRY